MKILRYTGYKPEQSFSPRVLLVVVIFLDILYMFGVQILSLNHPAANEAMLIYLIIFGFASAGILLDLVNSYAARWFTFLGSSLIIFIISFQIERPEMLILLFLPISLMASMTDLPATIVATGISTVALFIFRHIYNPDINPGIFWIALFACWAILAVLFSIYLPINRLAIYMSEHYANSDRMLKEARNRKVELEQALNGLANANRQMALANKKMADLSKIAEDAQKAKSMFVVNVSHEFRTPLNMIIGLIDLMVHNPENYDVVLSPKMREDFAVISRNCEHLTNMVSDVLDLTRVETGRLVLYREWVDLRDIIDKGITVVQPLMEKKHLYIRMEIPEDLPNIYCDRIRVQQVILNLLSNAARFTDKGGISLTVSHLKQKVTIQVTDTGSGIPPEDRERIFEPFWQGNDPIWQKKGGSGIGLSLSKEFVYLHGGKMWFESEPNQGTSFYFTLPISPPIEPLAKPGHLIKEDWVWKEKDFQSAKISSTSQMIKPRMIIYDETETLYPRFVHYTDKVEFVNLSDINQISHEGLAKAFIINASSFEKLWPMVQIALNTSTPTTVIGCSIPGEFRRALETGATGYLIKPIRMEDLQRILGSVSRPVRRILLVDDDIEVLKLYKRMLLTCDPSLEISTISSAVEAVQEAIQRPPDLMFLDIVMPEKSGWQVLEEISWVKTEKSFPIYFITAQDPVDQLASGYVLATIKGGIPLGKLINTSIEIASLFMESEQEPDRAPEQNLEDGLVSL
jgi:signal transduction histidine kinase/CheY-like chemotaxis protein